MKAFDQLGSILPDEITTSKTSPDSTHVMLR